MATSTRSYRHLLAVLLLSGWLAGSNAYGQPAGAKKYNFLFIVVDDLKPLLGCYGDGLAKSPRIDELAKGSTLFTSAYCQQAICGPTRTSVMTGWRPDRTRVWDLKTKMRDENPGIITLPSLFRSMGYYTLGMGKVFDPSNVDKGGDTASWSAPFMKTFPLPNGYGDIAYGIYQSPSVKAKVRASGDEDKDESQFYGPDKDSSIRFSTECLDVPDNAYMDGAMADHAVQQLQALGKNRKPFFMAVGFKKPHLPFVAPKKYWDLYKREQMPLAAWQQPSEGGPDVAYHNAGELRSYAADIKPMDGKGNLLRLPEDKQRELIHGYYACMSYTDAQIGKLLDELKKSGLDKNTIVILWGDHGWHLGDHSLWCKHSNFEQAARAPLMIRVPGMTKGVRYGSPVEFVDIFPTLCQLANLKCGDLDGKSLVPVLKNSRAVHKAYAISQYPRGFKGDPRGIMGYSLRDKRYRLTEWVGESFTTARAFDPAQIRATELYDYEKDPMETKNLALDPAYKNILESLSQKLHAYYAEQFSRLGKNTRKQ